MSKKNVVFDENGKPIREFSKMRAKNYLLLLLVNIIVLGILYYICFPAINIHSADTWLCLIIIFTINSLYIGIRNVGKTLATEKNFKGVVKTCAKGAGFIAGVDLIIILIVIIGAISGATIFRAKSYSKLLNVESREFAEDIPESTDKVSNIALMDTDSARIFGNREIGSLSDVVSQYEVSSSYNQISLGGSPMKVAALTYASFFKWLNNRSDGIPGYVKVNPVNSDASYVKLSEGLKYVPSGYFNDNLQRHIQFKYPTKIVNGYYFEIDEEGNPYYICPTLKARVGLFNGMDVEGAIICNPITGACKYYAVGDIPQWVDHVYDGDLCSQKYDWHGIYSGGFLNTLFSQKGCTRATSDYGYIVIDDDVWMYTGVTSLNADNSNVGFVMINERTSEARYYVVSGAEEDSAMKSAEGAVQEKNYEASFPSLINVAGQPTYIMVLKDSGGLVKMYAMVNVEQYNIVATATTQSEVFKTYKKMLASEGVSNGSDSENDAETITATITDIEYINKDEDTICYIKTDDYQVFYQNFSDNEELITLTEGDKVEFTLDPATSSDDSIKAIDGFEIISHGANINTNSSNLGGDTFNSDTLDDSGEVSVDVSGDGLTTITKTEY